MANFKTHLSGAFATSGLLGIVGYKMGLYGEHDFLICVALGTVGGLLPDIDSNNSIPIRLGFDFSALFFAFSLVMHWRSELSLLSLIVLWLLGYSFIRYGVFKLFTTLTVHRGVIHSVPCMAVLAMMLVYVTHHMMNTNMVTSWFYGLFLFIGALVHLSLDEMYSVDLLNRRLKRSSGTAMKFYQHKQRYHYLSLYTLLTVLIFITPPFEPFWTKLTDQTTWQLLKDNTLPTYFMRLLGEK